MTIVKMKSILIPFVTFSSILIAAVAIIFYSRGYRLNVTQKSLSTTGLLVATSDPVGAQLLIENKLTTATNATVTLPPGWYTVTMLKEGYQPWEKRIRVQGEVVTKIDAFLFPTSPSLSSLSAQGVSNPVLSPDGSKLAFVIPASAKSTLANRAGIWILDLSDKPLGLNRDAREIIRSDNVDFSESTLLWSPDSKQVVATVTTKIAGTSYYLLDIDKLNDPPHKIGEVNSLIQDWLDIVHTREKEKLGVLKEDITNVATTSAKGVNFSPDETKFFYEATKAATLPKVIVPPLIGTNSTPDVRDIQPGNMYLYDTKEDKNYLLKDISLNASPTPVGLIVGPLPIETYRQGQTPTSIRWLPTSRHLVVVGKERIDIMDYDGTNRKTIYAGPFWDSFVVPWTNGTKLVILTNLNPAASAVPNLYTINIH